MSICHRIAVNATRLSSPIPSIFKSGPASPVRCMTEVTDPRADYEVYWGANFRRNPAVMGHNSWQGTTIPKFMWATSLMRTHVWE